MIRTRAMIKIISRSGAGRTGRRAWRRRGRVKREVASRNEAARARAALHHRSHQRLQQLHDAG